MDTITLYRIIGWDELSVLLSEGKVEGRFETEMKQNTYQKSYGKVICTFTEPRFFDFATESASFLKIVVPIDRVIAEGEGTYHFYVGTHQTLLCTTLKEVFISYYLLSEVEISGYSLHHRNMIDELQSSHLGWIFDGLANGLSYEEIQENYSIYIDCKKLIPVFQRLLPHFHYLASLPIAKSLYTLFENKGSDIIKYQVLSNVTEKDLSKYGYERDKEYSFV